MQRMILFTIGSVQDFISNSRKAVDLQNASMILSEILSKLIRVLEKNYQGEVILPAREDSENISTVPNYFIASYQNEEPIGKELKSIAITEFSSKVNGFLKINSNNVEWRKMAESLSEQIQNQLQTALDIYWVDIPFQQEKERCIETLYEQIEAIKNTRNYDQLDEPEGEKCHLCGIRNGIICKKRKNGKFNVMIQKTFTYQTEKDISSIYKLFQKLKSSYPDQLFTRDVFIEKDFVLDFDQLQGLSKDLLKSGECLCAVCFAKRIAKLGNQKIPSLSGFALSDWLKEIDPKNMLDEEYVKDKLNEKEKQIEKPDQHQAVYRLWEIYPNAVKDRLKEYNNDYINKLPTPPTFYCLYRMDLDNLGKRLRKSEYDKELSRVIFQFLKTLLEKLDDQGSIKIVYAGGDDLLALMSLQKGFYFAKRVEQFFGDKVKKGDYLDLTYSQGLFFAHHKTTFADVLRSSRENLEEVKNKYKDLVPAKNGTVLSILSEGFNEQSVTFKNYGSLNLSNIEQLMDYFHQYSTYFHQVLGEEFLGLVSVEDLDTHAFLQMFTIEQQRLMKRSLINKNEQKEEEHLQKLQEAEALLRSFIYENCIDDDKIDLANYFNLLAIIKKLNSQMRGE